MVGGRADAVHVHVVCACCIISPERAWPLRTCVCACVRTGQDPLIFISLRRAFD